MSAAWPARLSPQFIDLLATIHGFEFRNAALPHFGIPDADADPRQAARWRVNLWSYMWRECAREPMPIFAVTEAWLRRNLPACSELVLLHGDFRTGNYLFDEESGDVTCILDWELSHIGDYHEDLAWTIATGFEIDPSAILPVAALIYGEEQEAVGLRWLLRRSEAFALRPGRHEGIGRQGLVDQLARSLDAGDG